MSAYHRWRTHLTNVGRDRQLTLPLRYVKGLSTEPTGARGLLKVDLTDSTLSLKASGLPKGSRFALWIVDNHPDSSVKPEATDHSFYVGSFGAYGNDESPTVALGALPLSDIELKPRRRDTGGREAHLGGHTLWLTDPVSEAVLCRAAWAPG